jgi:ABC-2 type transport system permease protein
MVLRIAKKELTEILRDGRFRWLAGLVLALSVTALAAGWNHFEEVDRQHQEAAQATRADWLEQPAKNPHSAAHYGMYAFKPKSRLSLVDPGIDSYVGVAAWLEAHRQNEFRYRPAQDRAAVQRLGELTAAESFLIVVPLFIVLVCFSAFAGEREQGTLGQLLSIGVPTRDLLRGKALALAAALGLVVVPATIIGVICLALTSEGEGLREDFARGIVLTAVYLAYFATVAAFSLGVSARMRSSRAALVVLLAIWFANTLIVPRAAADLAGWLHPAPSSIEFQRAMAEDLADQGELQQRLEARGAELMRQHGASSMNEVPINFSGISMQEGEEHANEVFDRHYGRLFDTYAEQNRAYSFIGLLSPMPPMRTLSMGLAGTDFDHHRAFVNAAEDYRRDVQRRMNGDIAQNSRPGQPYLADPALWAAVPEFDYAAPGLLQVLSDQRLSLLLLAGWLVASCWFAARSTARIAVE